MNFKPALVTIFTATVIACGSTPGGDAQSPGAGTGDAKTSTCSQKSAPASEKVIAAIDANSACNADADCIFVPVQTSCFDQCTRAVARSGEAAVNAAKQSASENECKAFADAGCKRVIPPCAPPSPPACRAGKCI